MALPASGGFCVARSFCRKSLPPSALWRRPYLLSITTLSSRLLRLRPILPKWCIASRPLSRTNGLMLMKLSTHTAVTVGMIFMLAFTRLRFPHYRRRTTTHVESRQFPAPALASSGCSASTSAVLRMRSTAILGKLVSLVAGGWAPWVQVDYFIGVLFGFSSNITLLQGLIGIIGTALFSSTAGMALFISGLMALFNLVLFAFDLVYTYLNALITIGVLLILSPIIVPLGAFLYDRKTCQKMDRRHAPGSNPDGSHAVRHAVVVHGNILYPYQ